MKSALQAIFYGDMELLNNNPHLYDTPIYIKFDYLKINRYNILQSVVFDDNLSKVIY